MRIVSYNILDGGEGRADPLAEIILAQKPDIVALVEADNVDVLERIGRRLGMDYIRAEGNSQHAVALMSRWPIVQSINHAACGATVPCLLEAAVRDPHGAEWIIGVVHLSPYAFEESERQREKELPAVLDAFAEYRTVGRAHMIMGDFNSNSPIQQIDPEQCSPRTRQAWQDNGGDVPRRVVQRMLDEGYLDAIHSAMGEAALTATTFTTQYPGQRVDYVFAHGVAPHRLKRAWIEKDRLGKYASDHFLIGVEVG